MTKDNTNPPDNDPKELLDAMKRMMEQNFTMKSQGFDEKKEPTENSSKKTENKKNVILDFNLKPKDIKKHLDQFVIKQNEAKKVLSTAICDHYNHAKNNLLNTGTPHYAKQNVLLLGPTGVGKTYLVKCIADFIGVPFVKADATKFSETGYVGGDVDDLVRGLIQKADGDIELAEHGIVYLDEVDKLAFQSQNMGRDISGGGVQRGLLKIMEETEVSTRNPQDIQSQFETIMNMQRGGDAKKKKNVINTRHILFIASGAFTGLNEIIEKRMQKKEIGFQNDRSGDKLSPFEIYSHAETGDLIQYGFEPEFVGRLPVRVALENLDKEDLYTILRDSKESILKQYQHSFSAYKIDCQVEDKAIWEMAKIASQEKTGARALYTVCEQVFRNLKYELPSSSLKSLRVTADMITDNQGTLDSLLAEDRNQRKKEILREIKQFEDHFFNETQLKIQFNTNASELVCENLVREEKGTFDYLQKMLSGYAHGLKLIEQTKPQDIYILDGDVVKNPNATLETWIKASFEK